MVDFELTEEQGDLREWVRGFAAEVVRPAAAEWDEREATPWPIIQEAAKIGLYGFEFIANCYTDDTGLSLPLVNEELFWGDAGIGMSIFGTNLAVAGIFNSGTSDQLMEWIPQCYGDTAEPKVAAFCSTEPEAGSDVAAMRTRAVYDEAADEWVLNGQKCFATNGGIANVHVVMASVDPSLGSRGQAAFVVPPDTAGLSSPAKMKKLGLRASHTADVYLDDVRVPGRCLLGEKDAKRFADSNGWGYAKFDIDLATGEFRPGDEKSFPPQGHDAKCGAACHVIAKSRDFAAWLGLTPLQKSTGGKQRLGSITKMGDRTLRRLLIIGSTAVVPAVAELFEFSQEFLLDRKRFGRKQPILFRKEALFGESAANLFQFFLFSGCDHLPAAIFFNASFTSSSADLA